MALPDILETYASIRQHYRQTERERRAAIFALLEDLRDRGKLDASDAELERILALHVLIARFWIAEARVSYANHSMQELVAHYQALLADTLRPYACDDSKAKLAPFLLRIICKSPSKS